MKNVLVNYLGRKGAGAVFSYEMARGLINNGCNVYAIIPDTIDNIEDWKKLSLKKLVTIKTYNSGKSFVTGVIRFFVKDKKKIIKEFKGVYIDCIYIPMLQPWAELINRIFPKAKLIVTQHDPIPHSGSKGVMNYLYTRVTKSADEVIILSEVFKKATSERYKINIDHVHVIPHGIFDYYSQYNPEKIERNSKFNFLFFGRITKYKGLHLLSEAYNKLHAEYPDTSLYVVGSGDFTDYKDEFLEENNITVVNRFIADSELVAYFRGNNIITVLPYIDATQSGIIPIAMKEKTLLVVSDQGGLAEQTQNGKYAILAKPNADDVYEKMKLAMNNYEDYQPMLDEAKEYIESLSWDRLAKMLMDCF